MAKKKKASEFNAGQQEMLDQLLLVAENEKGEELTQDEIDKITEGYKADLEDDGEVREDRAPIKPNPQDPMAPHESPNK